MTATSSPRRSDPAHRSSSPRRPVTSLQTCSSDTTPRPRTATSSSFTSSISPPQPSSASSTPKPQRCAILRSPSTNSSIDSRRLGSRDRSLHSGASTQRRESDRLGVIQRADAEDCFKQALIRVMSQHHVGRSNNTRRAEPIVRAASGPPIRQPHVPAHDHDPSAQVRPDTTQPTGHVATHTEPATVRPTCRSGDEPTPVPDPKGHVPPVIAQTITRG